MFTFCRSICNLPDKLFSSENEMRTTDMFTKTKRDKFIFSVREFCSFHILIKFSKNKWLYFYSSVLLIKVTLYITAHLLELNRINCISMHFVLQLFICLSFASNHSGHRSQYQNTWLRIARDVYKDVKKRILLSTIHTKLLVYASHCMALKIK